MFLLWGYISIVSVFHSCSGCRAFLRAYSPGDIIVGGLFNVHSKTNRSETPGELSCDGFYIQGFLQSQVMIYTIRELNQQRLLPNITIGYDIYDTCGDVSLAMRATLQLLKSDPQSCLLPGSVHSDLLEPQTKVVIGESTSEVSIAVAKLVTLSSVAQISYASTSELLSRKFKFPTFLRTVSSDAYQTKGIVELVTRLNWEAVAIVGSDDEYGRLGSNSLNKNFLKENVCVDFVNILPSDFNQNTSDTHVRLAKLVKQISNSPAEAIIVFTKGTNVKLIMEAAIKHKLNRTWIAGDSWSTSPVISTMPGIKLAGQVYGFIFNRKKVPGFKHHVLANFSGTHNAILEHYKGHYQFCENPPEENRTEDCQLPEHTQELKHCLDQRCLSTFIDQDFSFSIYLAVHVVFDSLRRLMRCDEHQCESDSKFSSLELFKEIQKTNLMVNTTHISFDSNGDPSLGYDIVYWNQSNSKRGIQIETIGEYWPNGKLKIPKDLEKIMNAVEVTPYNCSKTCKPGQELKFQRRKCCADCVPCAEGEFSPGNGEPCRLCGIKQYSLALNRNKCFNNSDEFQRWSARDSIFMSFFAALGVIVTIVFAILFTVHRSTPIVKAVGGYLCFLELLSLLLCFCLTFTFLGKPTSNCCRLGLPLFSMAFSLCISCILANLLQILLGFDFHLKVGSWMKKLNRPVAVVIVVSGIQVALSASWLILFPSVPHEIEITMTNLYTCEVQSKGFFAATISYNAFLALICFLFAFKGRQLPDLYKNAVLLSISMLLYLIIWSIFIPLFFKMKGKNTAPIESAAILISSYSILGFHLAPKCYIMVFRKELNNQNAITEYIKKYYEQQGIAVVKS